VAAFWNRNSDLTVDSDDWTINLMLPVTLTGKAERFYEIDIFLESQGPAVFMKPLESVLPMLTKILFEIIPKLLRSWNSISEYIEQFVASKFTFLDEKEHDNLLFDDDTFSRSRQYSWVITSTDEFIPIILKTIEKYSEVKQWLINLHEEKEKDWTEAEEYGKQLHAIAERFKTQKDRAEALREGVSFSRSDILFGD
jgi:hypothetical protein